MLTDSKKFPVQHKPLSVAVGLGGGLGGSRGVSGSLGEGSRGISGGLGSCTRPNFGRLLDAKNKEKPMVFFKVFLPRRDLPSAPRKMDIGLFMMVSGGGHRRKNQGKPMIFYIFSSETRST